MNFADMDREPPWPEPSDTEPHCNVTPDVRRGWLTRRYHTRWRVSECYGPVCRLYGRSFRSRERAERYARRWVDQEQRKRALTPKAFEVRA